MLNIRDLAAIIDSPLFAGCDIDRIKQFAENGKWKAVVFENHQTIYSPDSFEKKLGIFLSGKALVTKGELTVSELSKSEMFGAGALFNDEENYVSTITAKSKCRILFLSQEDVRELIDNDLRVRYNYISYLSNRIRFLSSKIDALSQGSGEKKLSLFLLRNMNEEGCVVLGCSMTELASRLNVGRASLYRDINKLEEEQIIERDGKTIFVKRPDALI